MNTVIPSSDKLDDDLNFLNSMIPNAEDYFSIIYALDKLSQSRILLLLNIPSIPRAAEKDSIWQSQDQDSSLLLILKEYNFGNRLITAGDIHIDPNF